MAWPVKGVSAWTGALQHPTGAAFSLSEGRNVLAKEDFYLAVQLQLKLSTVLVFASPPFRQGWPATAGHVLALPTIQPLRVHSGVQGSVPGSLQPGLHLCSGERLL